MSRSLGRTEESLRSFNLSTLIFSPRTKQLTDLVCRATHALTINIQSEPQPIELKKIDEKNAAYRLKDKRKPEAPAEKFRATRHGLDADLSPDLEGAMRPRTSALVLLRSEIVLHLNTYASRKSR